MRRCYRMGNYNRIFLHANSNRIITLLSILLLVFYTISVVITYRAQATNYEGSIYWSTPILYWVLAVAVFIFASFCIITNTSKDPSYRKIFILLLALAFLLSSIAHIIRGYYSIGMTVDPATHVGFIHTIIQTGHFNSYDIFYPGLHILTAEIFELSQIDTRLLLLYLPCFFSLLSLGWIYLFYREVSDSWDIFNTAFIISCALLVGSVTIFTPNMVGNAFIPIILYAGVKIYKNRSISMSVVLIILCIFIIILYLLSAIAVIVFLLSIGLPALLHGMVYDRNYDFSALYPSKIVPFIIAIMTVWLIYWLSFFRPWRILILNLESVVDSGYSIAHTTSTVERVNYASSFGYNIAETILRIYGPTLVVIFLAMVSLICMWKWWSVKHDNNIIFSMHGPIACYIIICGVLFLFNFNFGPLRFLSYINIIAPIVIGWLLVFWRNRNPPNANKLVKNIFIVVLISGLFIGCLLNNYSSPRILQTNYQDTEAELDGARWFLENRDAKYPLSGITFAPGRYAQALLTEDQKKINDLPNYLRSNLNLSFAASRKEDSNAFQAPYHFGYQESCDSIARYYNTETYLVLLERDLIYYKEQFVNLANDRWHPTDFYWLNHDPGLNLIYSNAGFETWIINA